MYLRDVMLVAFIARLIREFVTDPAGKDLAANEMRRLFGSRFTPQSWQQFCRQCGIEK